MTGRKNKRGFALLLTLTVMVILFILAAAYLGIIFSETALARNVSYSRKAFYLAEAGLERGLRHFIDDPDTGSLPWTATEYMGEGSFTVTNSYDDDTGRLIITSTGRVKNARRTTQLEIEVSAWKYALFADTDINAATAYGTVTGDVHANNTAAMGGISVNGTLTQGSLGQGFVLMPVVDMEYYEDLARREGQVIYGNYTITEHHNNQIIYVKAAQTEPGTVIIDTARAKGAGINIQKCIIIAEGGFIISGGKKLHGFRYTAGNRQYPLFITKHGDIMESGSGSDRNKRDIQGIIYSEKGKVRFESIMQDGGCIVAENIELLRNIWIKYDSKYVPNPPPGFYGGMEVFVWRELHN